MKFFILVLLLVTTTVWGDSNFPIGEYPSYYCYDQERLLHVQILQQPDTSEIKMAIFGDKTALTFPIAQNRVVSGGGNQQYSGGSPETFATLQFNLQKHDETRVNGYIHMQHNGNHTESALICSIVRY